MKSEGPKRQSFLFTLRDQDWAIIVLQPRRIGSRDVVEHVAAARRRYVLTLLLGNAVLVLHVGLVATQAIVPNGMQTWLDVREHNTSVVRWPLPTYNGCTLFA